ncbi:MAG: hypothetical protein A2297_04390 [Elusimicrobia bacterium RIFOXYB2_FULL_48_7]|nr:MAG: hypothetical protein A2297_04390 [Elusimicrobia bacterium RIFOXYB2_FULL_48_7]
MPKVSITVCKDYNPANLSRAIGENLELLGGLGNFIKPGERILVKPNLLGAHAPEEAVTTHPEFVRAVVRMVRHSGATPILGDSPSLMDIDDVWRKTGLKQVSAEENVEVMNFSNYAVKEFPINHPTIKNIYLSQFAFDVDGIINLPKFKTHELTTLTLGMKNFFGLVPGLNKVNYHKFAHSTELFSEVIAELYRIIRPKVRLTIIDGILGMDGEGPQLGRVRPMDLVLAGGDPLALDCVGYELFGINPSKIPLIKFCRERNLGETDINKITVVGVPIKQALVKDPLAPKSGLINYVAEPVKAVLLKYLWVKPKIMQGKCKQCMKCFEICPAKTIHKEGKQLNIHWDKCISCFCCMEVCSHKAIETRENFFIGMIRKVLRVVRKLTRKK